MYQLGDTALLSGLTTEEEGNVQGRNKFTQLDRFYQSVHEGTGQDNSITPRNVAVAQRWYDLCIGFRITNASNISPQAANIWECGTQRSKISFNRQ